MNTVKADEIDNGGWIDIERPTSKKVDTREAVLRIAKKDASRPARAFLVFRGKAAKWIARISHYRVQTAGSFINQLRIVPDEKAGRFIVTGKFMSKCMRLGIVAAWPDQVLHPVACEWIIVDGCMILTLPTELVRTATALNAISTPKQVDSAPTAALAPVSKARRARSQQTVFMEPAVRITRPNPPPEKRGAVSVTAALMGDPPFHRSALGQRGS